MKKVALVGRVNVGKSTLFNALTSKNIALVGDTPALTRDYQEDIVDLFDLNFILIDTPGFVTSRDTLSQCTNMKLKQVIQDCDVVLFVCNAKEIMTTVDLEILQFIRHQNKPFACLVNKADAKNALKENLSSFYEVGIDLLFVSAMNKDGFEDLYEYLQTNISSEDAFEHKDNELSLVILGKPNVGKSTLVNTLLGQDRVVVSDIPGTTRDFVTLDLDGTTIVDTAGISKKLGKKSDVERVAARRSLNNIKEGAIVLVIFDASQGITKQDLLIVSDILERGNPVIIGVNKIDLLTEYSGLYNRIVNEIRESIAQVKNIPVIIFSALQSKNVDKIVAKAKELHDLAKTKISTRSLNNYLVKMQANAPFSGKVKLKYITQTNVSPIKFLIFSNIIVLETYKRYVKNNLSEHFNLSELPVIIEYRKNYNPYTDT